MRKHVFVLLIATMFAACNNSSKEKTEYKMTGEADSTQKLPDSLLKNVMPTFTQLDARISASISAIINDYLDLKNALVKDDGSVAAQSGSQLATEIKNFDVALLNEEQRKLFSSVADDIKENAEHISESGNDIGHQREHFTTLSDDVFNLVKGFGGGRILYVDNCRMANDNKGAIWLSEFKEIKNPYFAGKMSECVRIDEIVK